MKFTKTTAALAATIQIALATIPGCDDGSARIAREAADRQAEQNKTMAQLEGDVAAGAKRLVEEDAKARFQTLEVHHDLQAERSQLAGDWDALEAERKQLAASRRTDSFLAALIKGGGGAMAAVLALAFAWLVLFGLRRHDESAEIVCHLLVEELDRPTFLAPLPRSLNGERCLSDATPSLPPPDGSKAQNNNTPKDPP